MPRGFDCVPKGGEVIAGLLDYHYQWTAVLAASFLSFSLFWVTPRFGLPAALLLSLSGLSSFWVWAFKDNRYLSVNIYDQVHLRFFACDSIAKLMIISVPLMLWSRNRWLMKFVGQVVASNFIVASAIFSLWEARNGCGGLRCGGLMGNPSISLGLSCAILPAVFSSWRRQWWIALLVGASVYNSESSIALGLFSLFVAISLCREFRAKASLVIAPAAFMALMWVGRLHLGSELTNDSDRFMVWRHMMHLWPAPWNIAFGTGLGTYQLFSLNLQNIPGHVIAPGYWWITMHNDGLQMLFECGIAGALLMGVTYLSALLKAIRESDFQIALSIFLYGIYMCLDPALHNPLPALFGAWLFIYALRRQNTFKECL